MNDRPTITPPEPTEAEMAATTERRRAELAAAQERDRLAAEQLATRAAANSAAAQARLARLAAAADHELRVTETAESWTDPATYRREEVFPRDFRRDLEWAEHVHLASWTLAKVDDRETLSDLRLFVNTGGTVKKTLVLYGGTGAGKTTAAIATAHQLMRAQGRQTRFISYPKYLDSQRPDGTNPDGVTSEKYAKRVTRADVLVIDDFAAGFPVGKAPGDPVTTVTRFVMDCTLDLLDARIDGSRATILTTNLSTKALSTMFDDRVMSRLGREAVVCEMKHVDRRAPVTW
ncbi:MAG: ATP-binding protein [Phycicoccus sp.]